MPHGDYNRVYILAASSGPDRNVAFQIGGHADSLKIENWGGFIGQWDDRQWIAKEKPRGRFCSRRNDATNRDERKRTRKQKATCRAMPPRTRRRDECRSSPPLRTATGRTAGARRAGSSPSNRTTRKISPNPKQRTCQSAPRARRTGLSGGLARLSTKGAVHHTKNAPSAEASRASRDLWDRTS